MLRWTTRRLTCRCSSSGALLNVSPLARAENLQSQIRTFVSVKEWRVHDHTPTLILTYPSPADNTTWDTASPQTPPPRSECAGRCPRKASRSSYSSAGTGGWTWAAYSCPRRKKQREPPCFNDNLHEVRFQINSRDPSQNRCRCVPVSSPLLWATRRWWLSWARMRGRGFCGALSSDSSDSWRQRHIRHREMSFMWEGGPQKSVDSQKRDQNIWEHLKTHLLKMEEYS